MKNILLIILLVLFYGCSKEETVRVGYTVLCDCKAKGFDVTYIDEKGNIVQETIDKDEWRKEFTSIDGEYVYVLSQANSTDATIATRVYYNGSIIDAETSYGDYAVAIASSKLEK